MDIRFLVTYKEQIVQLPVNPSEFKVPLTGNNTTQEVIKLGEVNLLRSRKLSDFTISSFFPQNASRSYVVTSRNFQKPEFYISFFQRIMDDKNKKPCILTVHGLGFHKDVTLESFEYEYIAGDDDVAYTLKFKEYVTHSAKTIVIKQTRVATPTVTTTATVTTQTSRPKTGIAIGDTVTVNGDYWYSSYGAEPHGTFNNFQGKVSHIVADKNRKYRYHITTLTGGYRGWVNESQINNGESVSTDTPVVNNTVTDPPTGVETTTTTTTATGSGSVSRVPSGGRPQVKH